MPQLSNTLYNISTIPMKGKIVAHQDTIKHIRELNQKTNQNLGKSPKYSLKALTLAESINNPIYIAECKTTLGIHYSMRGEVTSTLNHLNDAQDLFATIPLAKQDRSFVSIMHTAYGIIYDDLGQFLDSCWHFKQALDIANEIGYAYGQQRNLMNLGYIYSRLGLGTRAIDFLIQAVRHPLQDKHILSAAQDHLADSFESQGQWDIALRHRLKAIELVDDDAIIHQVKYHHKLIIIQLKLDHVEAAWKSAQLARIKLETLDAIEASNSLAFAKHYQVLSQLYLYEKDYLKAQQACKTAIEIAEDLGAINHVSEMHILLGEIELKQEQYQRALDILDQINIQELSSPGQKRLYTAMGQAYRALNQWKMVVEVSDKTQVLISQEQTDLHTLYKLQEETHKNDLIQKRNRLLNEKNEQLQTLYKEKDEILRIVAHDLKNPLTILYLSLDLIKHDQLTRENIVSPDLDEKLNLGLETIKRMQTIVSQLTVTSELDSQELLVNLEPHPILPALEQVRKQHCELAAAKHQKIILSNNIDSDTHVLADMMHLERIFSNLLSNAIKYSPCHKDIFIHVSNYGQHQVQIDIQDNGLGFSENDMQRLFKKYARLSAKPTGGEDSTGLGLYIVKKLIDALGGSITAHSAGKSQGSTFSVLLPIVEPVPQILKHSR